jgi:very-short-patch-repair endonuclease
MDEASQIKPEDALGAVARGGQLVVVGDPKQLPPTSFFDRLEDGDEEADEDLAEGVLEAESILDVAASAYAPPRILRWHYRSRHPSLIAFSNREFYGERLITFPNSVINTPRLGVKFHPVRGRYEDRHNIPEALAVLDFVFRHMRSHPHESLGVATLNTVQRDVILEEFEQRLKNEPSAHAYLTKWAEGLEPFFVKNLENVQGDERDVIVLSVTFGPDPSGRVYQRFGPINGPTGFRRLNVLVTRAKSRVEVFSSMHADDIRITESSPPGATALRNYLAYAETGVLEQARLTGREPDSDFEVDVAHALSQQGYGVQAQVGVAGYFLDLAVRHPHRPGRFILGVECDGASYHSAKSARDRDRLRQQVLEDKGWNIHHVWSTDWFRDPKREVDKIADRVKQLLELEPKEREEVSTEIQEVEVASIDGSQAAIMQEQEPAAQHEVGTTAYLSEADAREELATLARILEETFADVPSEQSILRPELLEALLRTKPRTREEWLRKIPLELRLDTAPEHMVLLDDILSIVSRIA